MKQLDATSSQSVSPAPWTRRRFLQTATSAAAVSSFMIAPQSILGAQGSSPNGKLNIGVIGAGGRGAEDIEGVKSQNIVALCDVDLQRAASNIKRFPKAVLYQDFRVMLEKQKDIDAVVIAIPDHVHAVASMAAI